MRFSRIFAMPSGDTFSITPIGAFVRKYTHGVIVDPFARNSNIATYTNDLNPETTAQLHMDAEEACLLWIEQGVRADVAIFDPSYRPRQITECYSAVGRAVGMQETQSGRMYRRARDRLCQLMKPGGVVLSFGWSSNGMGLKRGYEIEEIMLVAHGGRTTTRFAWPSGRCRARFFPAWKAAQRYPRLYHDRTRLPRHA